MRLNMRKLGVTGLIVGTAAGLAACGTPATPKTSPWKAFKVQTEAQRMVPVPGSHGRLLQETVDITITNVSHSTQLIDPYMSHIQFSYYQNNRRKAILGLPVDLAPGQSLHKTISYEVPPPGNFRVQNKVSIREFDPIPKADGGGEAVWPVDPAPGSHATWIEQPPQRSLGGQ